MAPPPDLLVPLWSTYGRDFEALLPIAWYCEQKLGMHVAFRSMFDVHEIHRLRPRAILIASSTGSMRCVELVREAYACNIPTVSLTAEGDFKPEMVEQMFWGLNTDRFLYEDVNLQWSERTRQMTLALYPEYAQRIRVSGAVGFDRYKIYRFMSRQDFLSRYASRDYDLVVGYAGYGFDRLQMPQFRSQYQAVHGKQGLERLIRDKESVRQILEETIRAYPDVLFVLKFHPGTLKRAGTEMHELERLPNTVVLWHEEIADTISACDLWTAFDSTTVLEAWLLGKPTLLINPSGPDFIRSPLYQGADIVQTVQELSAAIAEWQQSGAIQRFDNRQPQRQGLIRDIIQWDDGFNHVRAARVVADMLESPRPYRRPVAAAYTRWWSVHQWIRLAHVAPALVPIRRLKQVPQRFSATQLAAMQAQYGPQLTAFHRQHNQASEVEYAR